MKKIQYSSVQVHSTYTFLDRVPVQYLITKTILQEEMDLRQFGNYNQFKILQQFGERTLTRYI